ncbi:MAG: DKNYY domain-containing protein [Tannerella sp.]|nr:DKNYY domain-containing protein [Tannerella sp.]
MILLLNTCEQIPPMGGYVDRSKSNRFSYGIFKNSIYYKSGSPVTDIKGIFGIPTYSRLKGANVASFEVISWGIGKDKNTVYVGNEKQPHVDAATFHINSDGVACDNKSVFCGSYLHIIDEADPQSFEVIKGDYIWQWARDKNNYYYKYYHDCFNADVDYNTFQLINYSFAWDKNYLYTGNIATKELIKTKANPGGYTPVTKYYIHDDQNIYFCRYIYDRESSLVTIPLKDPESVQPFINTEEDDKDNFIVANNTIYYFGELFIK